MELLWRKLKLWREASLFNRAMDLIAREPSYFAIAEASLIEMRNHRLAQAIEKERNAAEVNRIAANMEAGITGMYD